jgi:hypothetical protein
MTKKLPAQCRKFAQHCFLYHALGTTGCVADRDLQALQRPGNVSVCQDYTAKLPMEFNNLPMSIGMGGGHPTVGMEGHVIKLMGDDGKEQWLWWGMVSDCPRQDAHTTFANDVIMITELQARGKLPRDTEPVLFQTSDGCSGQYKGAPSLWFGMIKSVLFAIVIDVMITASGHGKNLVDAMAGFDKALIKTYLQKGYDSATRDSNGKILPQSKVVIETLRRLWQQAAGNEDTKHKNRDGDNRFSSREY